jgi:para-nitrobenzyl esterase
MLTRLAAGLCLALAALSPWRTLAAIPDPIQTNDGLVSGVTLNSGVRAFKGIPFAAPPVGSLRWKEPQAPAHWEGVRKADTFGNVCVQPMAPKRVPNNVAVDLPDSPKMSEDCLYLNVWTDANRANARQPVMFWIYGGAYTEGAGSSPHNDGAALARKGVVLVTFNYRLGPFGFFSHPELTRESGRNASGNQALMDTIAALRWVQSNIGAFGGDPGNVTIFGQSAGAAMVGGLVGSPVAKGLFHRAIAESGQWMGLGMAPMIPLARAEHPQRFRGGPPGSQAKAEEPPADFPPLAELRSRSTDEIVKTLRGSGMIIDGWIVPEDLSITYAQGKQNPVDVLVGSNKDEHLAMGGKVAFRDTLVWSMRLFAERQTAIGQHSYWYFFTHEPPVDPGARDLKATHAAEIPYVFDNLSAPRSIPDTSSPRLAAASEKDRAVADMISSYWVNFAKKGDPNGKHLPQWSVFSNPDMPPHILGEITDCPSPDVLNAYNDQYAKMLAGLTSAPVKAEQAPSKPQARGNNLIQPLADLQKELKGKLERIVVHGKSLEGNLEGDSADRDVFVYLPPSYGREPARRYPVVYTLHGYGLHAEQWVGFANVSGLEKSIEAGAAKEMILVSPDAFSLHNGSFYSNSKTTGDWETFIAVELVSYIDSHYRTVPNRMSRGLAGHSMGGYGTFRIGMKHPEVFSSLYAMSACCMLDTAEVTPAMTQLETIQTREEAQKLPFNQKSPFARAAAWSSNPANPPLFIDLPVKDGKPRPVIAAKWMANSLMVMLQQYAPNLKEMTAIEMSVGLKDALLEGNRDMDEALTDAGVSHHFETFEGDHNGQVGLNFRTKVLPLFSNQLVFEK